MDKVSQINYENGRHALEAIEQIQMTLQSLKTELRNKLVVSPIETNENITELKERFAIAALDLFYSLNVVNDPSATSLKLDQSQTKSLLIQSNLLTPHHALTANSRLQIKANHIIHEASVYALYESKDKLESCSDNSQIHKGIVGIGITFSMSMDNRYIDHNNHSTIAPGTVMLRVATWTSENPGICLDAGITAFVVETALHRLIEEYNENFFTQPGIHRSGDFINKYAIRYVDSNPWIIGEARKLLISSLSSPVYIMLPTECPYCNQKYKRENHFKGGRCFIIKALQILSTGIKRSTKNGHSITCDQCGEGFTGDRGRVGHLSKRNCVILVALDHLVKRFKETPHLFADCDMLVKRMVHLLAVNFKEIHQLRDSIGPEDDPEIDLEEELEVVVAYEDRSGSEMDIDD